MKRNILTSTFIPHPLLDRKTFDSFALDFLMFGNAYVEARYNRLGGILRFNHAPPNTPGAGLTGISTGSPNTAMRVSRTCLNLVRCFT